MDGSQEPEGKTRCSEKRMRLRRAGGQEDEIITGPCDSQAVSRPPSAPVRTFVLGLGTQPKPRAISPLKYICRDTFSRHLFFQSL
ncbi:hypothetical protein CapIbe_010885 [Capra ibex]